MPDLDDERLALLVLLKRSSGGWGKLTRRVSEAGSALAIAAEEGLLSPTLFDEEVAWESEVEAARAAARRWSAENLQLVTVLDSEYPAALRDVSQQPPFVFLKGTRDAADHAGVAIIGSRRATDASLQAAHLLAAGLAEAGRVVVSGLAAGVDAAAHAGALAAGGRTVAIVGTGLLRTYPAANAELQRQIGDEGLLVSQFWPDAPPTKISFPMRNEVMSAWSSASLVVQADARSGARMQARVALSQGRRLFLYEPSLRTEEWALDYVRADRAMFVRTPSDLLKTL